MADMSREISKIVLPAPPNFEQAMGYPDDRRWVAFYWADDKPVCNDGDGPWDLRLTGWAAYVEHEFVRYLIDGFEFGSPGNIAKHWLLLDRQERFFYFGAPAAVATFLDQEIDCETEQRIQSADPIAEERAMVSWLNRYFENFSLSSPLNEIRRLS